MDQVKDRVSLTSGLPSINPTSSFWQRPPAPFASAQSDVLPSITDIAIIGSGVTGTSVAHALLASPTASKIRVTILEARTACSGATGRNGGHLVSDVGDHFEHLVDTLGVDEAVKILHFSEANIAQLKALVAQLDDADRAAIELREVNATSCLADRKTLEDVKRSLKLMQDTVGETTLKYSITEDQDVLKVSTILFSLHLTRASLMFHRTSTSTATASLYANNKELVLYGHIGSSQPSKSASWTGIKTGSRSRRIHLLRPFLTTMCMDTFYKPLAALSRQTRSSIVPTATCHTCYPLSPPKFSHSKAPCPFKIQDLLSQDSAIVTHGLRCTQVGLMHRLVVLPLASTMPSRILILERYSSEERVKRFLICCQVMTPT